MNVPRHSGSPWQVVASFDGYGPQSSATTVALSAPRPVMTTVSVTWAPGAVSWALIYVVIAGDPRTTVVSETWPHVGLVSATRSVPSIHST